MKIKVVVHEAEEGGYWAEVPAIPGCATQGETKEIINILTSEADLTERGLEFVRVFPKAQQLARGAKKRSKTPRRKIFPSRKGI